MVILMYNLHSLSLRVYAIQNLINQNGKCKERFTITSKRIRLGWHYVLTNGETATSSCTELRVELVSLWSGD
jgi:hypothetical protein